MWDISFYFWYEETHCEKHPDIDDCEDEYECEERDWCFTANIWNKQVMKIPSKKLTVDGDVFENLVAWILYFIEKYLTHNPPIND